MKEQKPISHLAAGLIIGAILIVFTLVIQFTGMETNSAIGWVSYLIILGGIIVFINLYGKAMDNQVSFGNLFSYGFKTTTVVTLVMILFSVILFLLFPDMKEKMFEVARQKMEERKDITADEIESGMSLWKRMFWVFTIGGILLLYAIIGAIASLIGAAITKKNKINPAG